jgi:hypothetical protein
VYQRESANREWSTRTASTFSAPKRTSGVSTHWKLEYP